MNRAYLTPDIETGGPIVEVGIDITSGATQFMRVLTVLTPDPNFTYARLLVRAFMHPEKPL